MSLSWRILRRLAWFGLAYLVLAGLLLALSAREHVRAEANGGALAAFLAATERVRSGDESALAELAAMRAEARIRHLDFELRRDGRALLPPPAAQPMAEREAAPAWQVAWTDAAGRAWSLALRPDPSAERAEVASDAALLAALTLGLATLIVAGVASSVRAEIAPLAGLTAAIAAYAQGDFAARVRPLRVAEFDAIARALNALADALSEARERARALSRRLAQAEDAQNRWVARELHDELGQWLTAARAEAAFLRARTEGAAREAAVSLERSLAETVARVRIVLERLRPHGFQDDPLAPAALEQAVRELAAGWRARQGVAAAIELRLALGARPLPNPVAMAAYRVAQEALSNAVRHGRAERVTVRLAQRGGELEVEVEDDGPGGAAGSDGPDGLGGTDTRAGLPADANARARPAAQAASASGRGLAGLAERVGALGGTLDAGPHATGWRVRVRLPLAPADAHAG